jgi:uncharacterized iron-regulated protein
MALLKLSSITIVFFTISLAANAQSLNAYQLFDAQGRKVDFGAMAEASAKADVVFFGESHNNPIAHWLQYELTRNLHERRDGKLALGMEMFEADNQLLLDEYSGELISERNFEEEARLWKNYATDYKPLVLFARSRQLPLIATNIPRRYANLVFRQGLDALHALSDEAKRYMAPLPLEVDLELDCYKDMLTMMAGHGGDARNLALAQAVKDATMAHFIAVNLSPGQVFLHFNGSYHSDRHQGIVWYLLRHLPSLNIVTISTVEQEHLDALAPEHFDKADFVLAVNANMTKTY